MKNLETRDIALVGLFAALTAVGAFIKIPLPFIPPITLQLFFAFLAGLVLGPKLAPLSQIVYIVTGLIGVPIFTEGGGPGYIFKPSFGFLLGFIFASWIVGKIIYRKGIPGRVHIFYAAIIALIINYMIGVPYVYLGLNYFVGKEISFLTTVKFCAVYLPGDLIKISILAVTGPPILRGIHSYKDA